MRLEKTLILEDVQGWLKDSPYVIVTDYTGLKVSQFSELRKRLRETGASMRVAKNTLVRRVLNELGLPPVDENLKGQTAIVFGQSEVTGAAKVLKNFTAEFQMPKVRVAVVDRAVMDAKQFQVLADLPSLDTLRSQLIGMISTPASQLVRLLNTPAAQVAQVLKAKSEKLS